MINKKIDINKVKSVYEIGGSWIWKYGRYQEQYIWDRTSYKNTIALVNKNTGEVIKGLKNIKRYIKNNELELESFM